MNEEAIEKSYIEKLRRDTLKKIEELESSIKESEINIENLKYSIEIDKINIKINTKLLSLYDIIKRI